MNAGPRDENERREALVVVMVVGVGRLSGTQFAALARGVVGRRM